MISERHPKIEMLSSRIQTWRLKTATMGKIMYFAFSNVNMYKI